MIPSSYDELLCCANCEHVFIRHEIEDKDEFFCHLDKSKRPICGSFQMDEDFRTKKDGETRGEHLMKRRQQNSIWDAWADARRVKAYGFCDKHSMSKNV